MSNLLIVDDNNFIVEVLQSEVPVLVDFGASWCSPCNRMIPVLEKFASDNSKAVKVVKVDIDDSPALASKYGIRSVPSLLLFSGGEKIDSKVGMTSLADLNKMLSSKA